MRPWEASSARSRRTRTSAACVSERSTAASTRSSTRSCRAAVGRAHRGAFGPQPVARGTEHAGRRRSRPRRAGSPRAARGRAARTSARPVAARPVAAPKASVSRASARVLTRACGRLDARRSRAAHVIRARVLDVDGPAGRRGGRAGRGADGPRSRRPARGRPDQDPRGRIVLQLSKASWATRRRWSSASLSIERWWSGSTSRPGRGGGAVRPRCARPPRAPRPGRRRAAPCGG